MPSAKSKSRIDGTLYSDADPLFGWMPSTTRQAVGYVASLTMTAIATVVAVGIDSHVTIPNLSLLFVLPVIVASIGFGLGPALVSAILGPLAYNFFLTEPRYSLAVDDPANIWAIGLLFAVGLVVSGVAFTSGRRATELQLLRRQVAVLKNYSRDVAASDSTRETVSVATQALAALFNCPALVMVVRDGSVTFVTESGGLKARDAELEAARSSLVDRAVVRGGLYPDLTSRFDFWPMPAEGGASAVIGLAFEPDSRPSAPEGFVDTVGNILLVAVERHSLLRRDTQTAS